MHIVFITHYFSEVSSQLLWGQNEDTVAVTDTGNWNEAGGPGMQKYRKVTGFIICCIV